MPGTVRSASLSVVTWVSAKSCLEITDTDFGVSSKGATNLEFADFSTLKLPCAAA